MKNLEDEVTSDDIRAAVDTCILNEDQAARLTKLVRERRLAIQSRDDEPLFIFRGFSEIFVAIGLILLSVGTIAIESIADGFEYISLGFAAVSWLLSIFLVSKRRMTLPGMLLVAMFAGSLASAVLEFFLPFRNVGQDRGHNCLHCRINWSAVMV